MPEMPTDERIAALKAQFSDRVLRLVESVDGEGKGEVVLNSVMVGPSRDEYDIYSQKLLAALETKDQGDRTKAVRLVVENAALGLIKWPDRETVKKAFEARPKIIDAFGPTIDELAGGQIENRSKNL